MTGGSLAPLVSRELPDLPVRNILIEPSPRDSAPAIALAAAVIQQRDPSAVMGSFAADHVIGDLGAFAETLKKAISGARQGYLMTVGITPTHPETGYGYVRCGGPVGDGQVLRVENFKEKPELAAAKEYFDSGQYLWNASFFVWQVETFMRELNNLHPEMHDGLLRIARAWDTNVREEVLEEIWPTLPKIAIEYLLMEPASQAGLVATVPGDFGWNDIGDYHALGQIHPEDERGNVVILDSAVGDVKSQVMIRDSDKIVVVGETDRLIVAVGLRDVVIVDTGDVLMVCDRNRAQEVKGVVEALQARGATKYI